MNITSTIKNDSQTSLANTSSTSGNINDSSNIAIDILQNQNTSTVSSSLSTRMSSNNDEDKKISKTAIPTILTLSPEQERAILQLAANKDFTALVKEANKFFANCPFMQQTIKRVIDQINAETIEPAKDKKLSPHERLTKQLQRLATQRTHLVKFLNLTQEDQRSNLELAYRSLIRSLEKDPLRDDSSTQPKLEEIIRREIIDLALELKKKVDDHTTPGWTYLHLVKALGSTLDLIFFYQQAFGVKMLTEKDCNSLIKIRKKLKRLNGSFYNVELAFGIDYVKGALDRLNSDFAWMKKVIDPLYQIRRLLCLNNNSCYVTAASLQEKDNPLVKVIFRREISNDFLEVALRNLLNNCFPKKEERFEQILVLKSLAIEALANENMLQGILTIIDNHKKKCHTFLMGAMTVLSFIARETHDASILKQILHGITSSISGKKLSGLLDLAFEEKIEERLHAVRALIEIKQSLTDHANSTTQTLLNDVEKFLHHLEDDYFFFDQNVHIGEFINAVPGLEIPQQQPNSTNDIINFIMDHCLLLNEATANKPRILPSHYTIFNIRMEKNDLAILKNGELAIRNFQSLRDFASKLPGVIGFDFRKCRFESRFQKESDSALYAFLKWMILLSCYDKDDAFVVEKSKQFRILLLPRQFNSLTFILLCAMIKNWPLEMYVGLESASIDKIREDMLLEIYQETGVGALFIKDYGWLAAPYKNFVSFPESMEDYDMEIRNPEKFLEKLQAADGKILNNYEEFKSNQNSVLNNSATAQANRSMESWLQRSLEIQLATNSSEIIFHMQPFRRKST